MSESALRRPRISSLCFPKPSAWDGQGGVLWPDIRTRYFSQNAVSRQKPSFFTVLAIEGTDEPVTRWLEWQLMAESSAKTEGKNRALLEGKNRCRLANGERQSNVSTRSYL